MNRCVIMNIVWSLFVLLFPKLAFSGDGNCPDFIKCRSSVTKDSCAPGTFYRENVEVHGCCPGCVSGLKGENEACSKSEDCQPGLKCSTEFKCEKDPLQACEIYKRFDPILLKTKYWNPNCVTDGSFAPKQCKGEKMAGKCFCVDKMGNRIFGEEEWSKADNMTCACSRLMAEFKEKDEPATLHCDHQGNFEPLQCDLRQCWCANPATGTPYTLMVPLEMINALPCFNRDSVGAQYYRRCDSVNHMQEVVKNLLQNHGTTGIRFQQQKCNFDGSYHRVQILNEKTRCVYLDESPITEAVESKNANCNCAYDRHVAKIQQTEFSADCESNGNYRSRQYWNGKEYCIDQDGFHFSDDHRDC